MMGRSKEDTLMRSDAKWLDDNVTETCMGRGCKQKFGILNSKHHCRYCGKIFCDKCAPLVPLPGGTPLLKSNLKEVRKCNSCKLPACFIPRRHTPDAKLSVEPIETIMSYLDNRSINALLQTCSLSRNQFHVRGVPYFERMQERFPSLFSGAKVGRGGCGTVYKVEDRHRNEEKVAVKVVEKSSIYCFSSWKKLFAEIDIMQGTEHENIASLLEVFQTPNELVLVIELGEGGSLKRAYDYMRKKKFNLEVFTAHVISQVSKALDYLFRVRGIVHRDIKHDNIVLSRDFSRVMVIDFGLAEYIHSDTNQKFVPCGTMGFASPENILAVVERRATFAADGYTMHVSDMFSLGVVSFMLLSGTKPMKGTRFAELHNEVRRGLRCQGSRWQDVSSEAKQLIEWMLHNTTRLRAAPSDVASHPFITKNIMKFTAIEVDRKGELEQEDEEEEDEWVFVGALRISEAWRVIDEFGDEVIGDPSSPSAQAQPQSPVDGASNMMALSPSLPPSNNHHHQNHSSHNNPPNHQRSISQESL